MPLTDQEAIASQAEAWRAVWAELCSIDNDALLQPGTGKSCAVALIRTLAARRKVSIPLGWKLVPISPTSEMNKAAAEHIANGDTDARDDYEVTGRLLAIYRAMLDAAPAVGAQP